MMYVETYCILLSIPIIAILHFSSVIKKEITKREKDRGYCESDLMESETMRNYLYSPEYKSVRGNIESSSIVFVVFIFIMLIMSIFNGTPSEMNITSLHASIILFILLILGFILIITAVVPKKKKEDNYLEKIKDLETSFSEKIKSFADFPEAFKKPFIERWLSLQNPNEILTYGEIIAAIDTEFLKPSNMVGFLRPADNYFFEDKDVVYKKDSSYLKSGKDLPSLSEFNTEIRKFNEIVAWLILIFLYYHIYHIYYNEVEMFVHIVIILIIVLIFCMAVYYMTIAKYEL